MILSILIVPALAATPKPYGDVTFGVAPEVSSYSQGTQSKSYSTHNLAAGQYTLTKWAKVLEYFPNLQGKPGSYGPPGAPGLPGAPAGYNGCKGACNFTPVIRGPPGPPADCNIHRGDHLVGSRFPQND